VIAKASQNLVLPILLISISELLNEVRRRTFEVDGELLKAREWHRRIFAAIERHDSDLACELMAGHMEQVRRGLESYEAAHK
jgi:DNA-binding FadR family transcriptional regulator